MQQTELGLNLSTKRTRKREFLAQMERVVPWTELEALIAPYAPQGLRGRPPFLVSTMLRIHFMQQWFTLSDPAMEEALHDVPLFREFAALNYETRLPDESTILRFRHLLEENKLAAQILQTVNELLQAKGLLLKAGTVVDATLIAAPSSTKNASGERDPEMHQTKKGNQWHFGMKAHIGVDVDSGLVHTVTTTAANASDVSQVEALLHGKEEVVHADAGYIGAQQRVKSGKREWHIAAKRGAVKAIKDAKLKQIVEELETLKARIRARVEHPFRVIKRQFGFMKVRFKGLAKNTAQVITLFALSNLWMARKRLLTPTGPLRPQFAS